MNRLAPRLGSCTRATCCASPHSMLKLYFTDVAAALSAKTKGQLADLSGGGPPQKHSAQADPLLWSTCQTAAQSSRTPATEWLRSFKKTGLSRCTVNLTKRTAAVFGVSVPLAIEAPCVEATTSQHRGETGTTCGRLSAGTTRAEQMHDYHAQLQENLAAKRHS